MNFLRKSSKNNLVKSIHIVSEEGRQAERAICAEGECPNLNQPEIKSDKINTLRDSLEKTQQEIKRFQQENERLDSARIIEEDKANYFENLFNERETEILSLTTRIETLTLQNSELKDRRCSKLYEIKTEYMTSLEAELKRVKDESAKTVTRLQRKIKKLQETYAKSKQEYALKVFALRDENNKLAETNEALQGALRKSKKKEKCEAVDTHVAVESVDEANQPRSQLIIELSQQVTSLDVENTELREELRKVNTLLNRLQFSGRTRKLRYKHELEQLCVHTTNLDVRTSNSELQLMG